jgi:dTDP-glucose pyrophosphorylase
MREGIVLAGGRGTPLFQTTPDEQSQFKRLIGDGSNWGVRFNYEVQPRPAGLAQALKMRQKIRVYLERFFYVLPPAFVFYLFRLVHFKASNLVHWVR